MKYVVSQRCSIIEVFWKTSQNSQINLRNSHPEVFCQKMCYKNFAKFTEKYLCRNLFFNKVPGWKPETVRSSQWICSVKQGQKQSQSYSVKKVFLEILQNSQENTWVFFFNKVTDLRLATLFKIRLWHRCFLWISRNF